jgi:hypothetical protein
MSFPWLPPPAVPAGGAAHRLQAAVAEIASRAGLFYRLGYSVQAATARLAASVAWEYTPASRRGPHHRPAELSDAAIAKIVVDTYARRPA